MASRTIAVYHDRGTGPFSRGCLMHALTRRFASDAQVRRILAPEIRSSDDWHRDTRILVIPGGADLPYCADLDGAGNASILRYIEAGGAFFGVCAGAYYASARIAFEPRSPGEITGERELALFQGTARGSLHELAEPYALDHLRCAAVARVHAPTLGRDLHALYWGGPELIPEPGTTFQPLLTYVTPDHRNALAALQLDRGKGRVVLTGVHAEITGAQFPIEVSLFPEDSFEHGMQVSAALTRVEDDRQELFDLLVDALVS